MAGSLIANTVFALYRGFGTLGAPLIERHMDKRLARGKEDAERFGERFGRSSIARPEGTLIWIHGASVGESVSALPLIERLRKDRPDLKILVTTGTVTSAKMMVQRLPEGVIHQFAPIDTPAAVRGFFDHWHPQLGLMIESEFWPNLLLEARKRQIPLHLINGRMSRKSFRGWKRSGPVFRSLLKSFASIQAQSPEDQRHFQALGFADCTSPGNLKFAAPPLQADAEELARLRAEIGDRPTWLIYSSHPGEEIIAAQAHQRVAWTYPDLLTMVVPRHPERGPIVAEELRANEMTVTLRSKGKPLTPETQMYVADTLGELGLWFRLNPVAVMGGTLAPKGGQNPIEAAHLGCALICGPHCGNFQRIVEDMSAAGALKPIVDRPGTLAAAVVKLLREPAARAEMSSAAKAYAEDQGEVLERVMALLDPALDQLK
ncbi:3-deoxy-D-manno-octulosonic acid transferase [Denitrobaculum tricleocarpae]|uniref:3-deoxy-D-manno-octulosonic acid transferase n=1 Tax=Denitrobaculum tricleocarpae TaxID=2591009 RepID=A0A545U2D4_9PROT|nr:3-deoxy-D-manno-octulosonic acid transferase [Denitrobaculum tricleocarpae]TQV83637.1 3-deoxy-D-manno-octulosonic acid transferase [Denitrobaculum tricleocarpae]